MRTKIIAITQGKIYLSLQALESQLNIKLSFNKDQLQFIINNGNPEDFRKFLEQYASTLNVKTFLNINNRLTRAEFNQYTWNGLLRNSKKHNVFYTMQYFFQILLQLSNPKEMPKFDASGKLTSVSYLGPRKYLFDALGVFMTSSVIMHRDKPHLILAGLAMYLSLYLLPMVKAYGHELCHVFQRLILEELRQQRIQYPKLSYAQMEKPLWDFVLSDMPSEKRLAKVIESLTTNIL